ncbi:MAG: DNA replication complex GINS family protein [Candidatus Bathyarchaeota archaeon]|nr:MAG: DNA replication complex GINS family protein [Candidatus Bathyarchaeota archaeon]
MYDLLYDAWLIEKRNIELQKLPKGFFAKMAEYIRKIRQEGRMLDRKSPKANLISKELTNVRKLMDELVKLRFEKIISYATSANVAEHETLTLEEERLFVGVRPSFENFQTSIKDSMRGKIPKVDEVIIPTKRILLRFLKEIPAIAGADMQTYGPFSVEDVAIVPIENAKVLLKRGVAMKVEIE